MTENKTSVPFRVLCLDGGGMRGVYQAAFLDTFATRVTSNLKQSDVIDIGKAFDLVVGTSTGGIVACALTAGVSLELVRALYRDHGGEIFPHQWLRSTWMLGKLVRGFGLGLRRGDAALRSVLTQTLGTRTIREVYEARDCSRDPHSGHESSCCGGVQDAAPGPPEWAGQ